MGIKSVETKYMEERESLMRSLANLDRRNCLRVSGAAAAAVLSKNLAFPHTFQPVRVAGADVEPFRFAYISDSHLYDKTVNDRNRERTKRSFTVLS